MTRSQPDGYYEEEQEKSKVEAKQEPKLEVIRPEFPAWYMNDDGTITGSALAHHRALLYTFIETAIAHNDKIIKDFNSKPEEIKEETESVIIKTKPIVPEITKADINQILIKMYRPGGVKAWWYRPRKALDDKTPQEVWETEPQKVIDVFNELLREHNERKDKGL